MDVRGLGADAIPRSRWLHRGLLGFAFAYLATLALVAATWPEFDLLLGVIPATMVAVMQIFEMWIGPWLRYRRGRTLDEAELGAVRPWLEALVDAGRIPPFRLRVQDGRKVNAVTSGGAHRHFIVVGSGLLDQLSTAEVKAVLAQEIGQVLSCNMARRLIPLVCVNFALHALYFSSLIAVLGWSAFTAVLGGVGMALFWQIIPGFFQRRWVFEGDRRAAELLGDPGALAQALTKFSEVAGINLDERPPTQPPMRARLEALKRLDQARG